MKITYKTLLYISLVAAITYSCDNEVVDFGQSIPDVETGTADLTDSDGDGLTDVAENKLWGQDTDGDGIPDYLDTDDDNDGILTADENPDANGNGVPDDAWDLDGDGYPNYLDSDDDGDGLLTIYEGPLTLQDSDEDGILDYLDDDDDNDGVPSLEEDAAGGRNSDNDGTPDYLDTDDDNDGVLTIFEGFDEELDTDDDGVLNYLDADDDGDGKTTEFERADPDGDGDPADAVDSDGDGIPDYLDIYNFDLSICDSEDGVPGDNFTIFDLQYYADEVVVGDATNIEVSFHSTENGAFYNNNTVELMYVNANQLQDILYMRIKNTDTNTFYIDELYLFVTNSTDTYGNTCD